MVLLLSDQLERIKLSTYTQLITRNRMQAQDVENLSTCRKVLKLSKERLNDKVSLTAVSAKGFALWKPTIFWKKLSKTLVLFLSDQRE